MRDIFVLIFIIAGVFASIGGGPFYALLFYLWNAYFRPQEWVFTGWVASLRLSYVTAVFVPVAMVLWAQPPRFSRWLVTPLLFVAACGTFATFAATTAAAFFLAGAPARLRGVSASC